MGICGSSVVHQDGATTLRRGPDQARRKRDARELRRLPAASPTLPHARSFLRLQGHLRPGGGQGLRQEIQRHVRPAHVHQPQQGHRLPRGVREPLRRRGQTVLPDHLRAPLKERDCCLAAEIGSCSFIYSGGRGYRLFDLEPPEI
nr:uncharacterized protein LOC113802618 [Penaeus vannamei]